MIVFKSIIQKHFSVILRTTLPYVFKVRIYITFLKRPKTVCIVLIKILEMMAKILK